MLIAATAVSLQETTTNRYQVNLNGVMATIIQTDTSSLHWSLLTLSKSRVNDVVSSLSALHE
jgi:hypothetical protein